LSRRPRLVIAAEQRSRRHLERHAAISAGGIRCADDVALRWTEQVVNPRRWLAYRQTRVEREPDGRWHATRPDWWGWTREHLGSWTGIVADTPEEARARLDEYQEWLAQLHRAGTEGLIE